MLDSANDLAKRRRSRQVRINLKVTRLEVDLQDSKPLPEKPKKAIAKKKKAKAVTSKIAFAEPK